MGYAKQRNVIDYSGDPVSDSMAHECVEHAGKLLAHVMEWIKNRAGFAVITEDQLEQEALGWLVETGYTHLYGPDTVDKLGDKLPHACQRQLKTHRYSMSVNIPTVSRRSGHHHAEENSPRAD